MDSKELGDSLRSSRGKAVEQHFNSPAPQEQGHHHGGYNNHILNWGEPSNYVDANNFNALPWVAIDHYPWLSEHQMHTTSSYYFPVSHGPYVTSALPPSQDYVTANNFNAMPRAMYNDYSPFSFPHRYGRPQMAYGQFPPRAPSPFQSMSGDPRLSLHQMHPRPPVHFPVSCALGLQTGYLDTSRPESSRYVHPHPVGGQRSGEQSAPQRFEYAINGPRDSNLKGMGFALDARVVEVTSAYYAHCNSPNFMTDYERAKFFVIKSFHEVNIHRSIKYEAWVSTKPELQKLDAANREAKEAKGICPVFLFFSVNTSGKFVGVAEMIGPVDFGKTEDYWIGNRWIGQFPVKWHIIRDVPYHLLEHILLENNDNRPITYSRNGQEVELENGIQMLKIFKNHEAETSLIEDLPIYETLQRKMKEMEDNLFETLKHNPGRPDFRLFS